jgi:hypothetical protein
VPEKFQHYRRAQPYSLTIDVHGGEIYGEHSGRLSYKLYEQMPGTKGACGRTAACSRPRRRTLSAHDLTMINWPGNDYRDRSIIDCSAAQTARRCRTRSASASASCTGCKPKRRPPATRAAHPS